MSKGKLIPVEGRVVEDLSNNKYKVELDNGVVVNAYIGGKVRINNIKIIVGDVVTVELTPYDITTGRIVYRKNGK
jgi:translation initiation factor IF-1